MEEADKADENSNNSAIRQEWWRLLSSSLKKWGRDWFFAFFALFVLVAGGAIWYQPPLCKVKSPSVSWEYLGKKGDGADIYSPLSMPTRYYVRLPHELRRRYQWFSVDRRREVCAISPAPSRSFLGLPAIRRSDPLGLDLEFRKLDGSEWRVAFEDRSIVFSNAVLSVRLDK